MGGGGGAMVLQTGLALLTRGAIQVRSPRIISFLEYSRIIRIIVLLCPNYSSLFVCGVPWFSTPSKPEGLARYAVPELFVF